MGETMGDQISDHQMGLFENRVLPDLTVNIRLTLEFI